MNAPGRRPEPPPSPSDQPPADEEFARTYAAGYEDGVRSALREVLQHTSRGHTAQELRILVESRLARLPEEVEIKRKSLLAPPRRPAWGSLLRPPGATRPWPGPVPSGTPPTVRITPGKSLLVREERPARALEILRSNIPNFPRLAPGEIGGRLRDPTEAEGGALLYVDALEYLATEYSLDTTLKFVHWLAAQARETGSGLIVSFDRRALDLREMSLLERAFETVI